MTARIHQSILLTPEDEFVYRPMAVGEPFSRGHATRHRLDAIAHHLGAELLRGALATVEDRTRTAITADGRRLAYDALVLAVGAGSAPVLQRALTRTPESDADVYGGLLRDLGEGYTTPERCARTSTPSASRCRPACGRRATRSPFRSSRAAWPPNRPTRRRKPSPPGRRRAA